MALGLAFFFQLKAQNQTDFSVQATALLETLALETPSQGFGLSLWRGDSLYYEYYQGWAKPDQALDSTSIFRLVSVSKVFTALGIWQLHHQGLLDVDSPLVAYLPDFQPSIKFGLRPITLRHLLQHSSGLSENLWSVFFAQEACSCPRLLQALQPEYLGQEAGLLRVYSNLGYGLLGCVLERQTGLSYENYIQKHILQVLGLNRSFVWTETQHQHRADLAWGYDQDFQPQAQEAFLALLGAGGLCANLNDLSRFAQALLRADSALGSLACQALLEPQAQLALSAEHFTAGLSLIQLPPNQNEVLGPLLVHGGDSDYFHVIFALFPRLGLTAVLASNGGQAKEAFCNEALGAIFNLYFKQNFGDSIFFERDNPSKTQIPNFKPEALAGYYDLGLSPKDDQTWALALWPRMGGGFRVDWGGESLRFLPWRGGGYTLKKGDKSLYPNHFFNFIAWDTSFYLASFDKKTGNLTAVWARRQAWPLPKAADFFSGLRPSICEVSREGLLAGLESLEPSFLRFDAKNQRLILTISSPLRPWEQRVLSFRPLTADLAFGEGCLRGAWTSLRYLGGGWWWWSGFRFRLLEQP